MLKVLLLWLGNLIYWVNHLITHYISLVNFISVKIKERCKLIFEKCLSHSSPDINPKLACKFYGVCP